MIFWRIFLTFTGTLIGAILGLFLMDVARGWNDLSVYLLSGAIVGAACGWGIAPVIPRTVERFADKYNPSNPPIPPPRSVVHFGEIMGLAEGGVVGAIYGGTIAAFIGGYMGMPIGAMTAILSWRIRRHIPLLVLALFLGFLIEVGGCLLIVLIVRGVPRDAVTSCLFIVVAFLAILFRLRVHWHAARIRRLRKAQQEEDFGPHGI